MKNDMLVHKKYMHSQFLYDAEIEGEKLINLSKTFYQNN